ncbi:hypothetical protein NDU88_002014 [Pleurodeles waltl]|uniref:Uncharacterized protein n=1 Tax=Pleurodeles waltl TaxID=8319 RepID=A0AAV7PE50_PLEWA|nr:hypothetical protein NDU88_002014 [Pleurodeles waltl]
MVAVMEGAPAEPGRRHGCERMLRWGPGGKVPARAPQPERPPGPRDFRLWRSGRNLPAWAPPKHSLASMPAPRLSLGALHYGDHIEVLNAKGPAAVIDLN